MIRYAMDNNANDAGEYIIKKMSKAALAVAESDGKTLEQWAQGKRPYQQTSWVLP